MRGRASIVVAVAAIVITGLTGCGGAPEPTPTPTAAETPAPSPTPSDTPESVAREAHTLFDAWDAYLSCRTLSQPYFTGPDGAWDPGRIEYAPFDASDVVERTDGLFYVYIEVVNGNGATDATRDVAAECIVGGTLGDPRFELYGARTRAPSSERDPDAPLPSA
jgi:hypothetical protein